MAKTNAPDHLDPAAKSAPRASKPKPDGETEVLTTLAAMPEPDRTLGQRVHAILKATAPGLSAKLWYGMPAYARDGKVVCFFQSAEKFKTRYATLGFTHEANLDDGSMWPTAFALGDVSDVEAERIRLLVSRATSPGANLRP